MERLSCLFAKPTQSFIDSVGAKKHMGEMRSCSSNKIYSLFRFLFLVTFFVLIEQQIRLFLNATTMSGGKTTQLCHENDDNDAMLYTNHSSLSYQVMPGSLFPPNSFSMIPNETATTTTVKKKQINSFRTKKRLEFVHIPKTGGTSIENVALKHNISWGVCRFLTFGETKQNKMSVLCPGRKAKRWEKLAPGMIPCKGAAFWHLPPYIYDNIGGGMNPYGNATLFAVIRNPYERIVSEYNYRRKIFKQANTSLQQLGNLNGWIQKVLTPRLDYVNDPYPWNKPGFCHIQGHLIPQKYYIYTSLGGGRQAVDHVLKFENLQEEFDTLMMEYGLNMTLKESPALLKSRDDDDKTTGRHPSSSTTTIKTRGSSKTLGVENLTRASTKLIEQVYAMDFEAFGYSTSAIL